MAGREFTMTILGRTIEHVPFVVQKEVLRLPCESALSEAERARNDMVMIFSVASVSLW